MASTFTVPGSSQFLMMIGKCITDWAGIEEQLFHVCHEILGVTMEQCAIIYYRTPTLETRLQLVDELINDVFPKPEKKDGGHPPIEIKQWAALLSDMRDQMPIRNQLAHQPVSMGVFASVDKENKADGDIRLEPLSYPPYTELARGKSAGKLPLTLAGLKEYEPKILALYNRLTAFRQGPLKEQLAKRPRPTRELQKGPE